MFGVEKIFEEGTFDDYKKEIVKNVIIEINQQSDDYILNVNEEEYIQYLYAKHMIEPLVIHFDNITISQVEKNIHAELFPFDIFVHKGRIYKKQVIQYHIPYEGDKKLIFCRPNIYHYCSCKVEVDSNCITFEIINFRNDANIIKKEANETIERIKSIYKNLVKDMEDFSMEFKPLIRQEFDKRKKHHLDNLNLMKELGVSLKVKNAPPTFSVPLHAKEKIAVRKPIVKTTGYDPEPTLQNETYNRILRIIQDVGKEFERLPSTYHQKTEEDLRDHILLFLEPNFEGSATGETFNKTGKTDILLRYESSNIFIAECKFWTGQKGYLNTITQLLSYLTWRDSKAAVIMFSRNKEFSRVINIVSDVTSNHPNYLGFIDKSDETWFNFRFHVNGDANREVKIAVMLFHIP